MAYCFRNNNVIQLAIFVVVVWNEEVTTQFITGMIMKNVKIKKKKNGFDKCSVICV